MARNVLEGLAKQGGLPTDNISAKLTENEYVIPADVVIALGKGNAKAGVAFFDELVSKVRAKTQGMLSNMQGTK